MKPAPTQRKGALTPDDFEKVRATVLDYVRENGSITNRLLRTLTRISYDQAIWVFGTMVKAGDLERVGKSSSTKYVIATRAGLKKPATKS